MCFSLNLVYVVLYIQILSLVREKKSLAERGYHVEAMNPYWLQETKTLSEEDPLCPLCSPVCKVY